MKIWIFIFLFFLILIIIALINYKINNEFKIETSWLALSLAPVVIWLLTTQQLSEFSGFGLAFKLKEVTSTPVSLQIDGNAITPEKISRDEKEGVGKIESFKRNRVAAITLVVGKRGYYANRAIEKYLKELTPLSFFKYVLFEDKSGEFIGIISGIKLLEELQSGSMNLVKLIESGDVSSIDGISTVSVISGSSKQQSLQLMDSHGLSEIPVVNEFNVFIGVVERDKITSSIVAQLVSSSNKAN
jgi:CBS domain containing-hemolysin-like protein